MVAWVPSSFEERTAACDTNGEINNIGLMVFTRKPLYAPNALFAFEISLMISLSNKAVPSSMGSFSGTCILSLKIRALLK